MAASRTRHTPSICAAADARTESRATAGSPLMLPSRRNRRTHSRTDPHNPVPTKGGAELGTGGGIAPQNDVEARADVLVYTTPPLDRDTEVTGEIVARLYITTQAPSTDFTAKLVDVHPNGAAYNVTDGILRRRYTPQVDPARATPQPIDVQALADEYGVSPRASHSPGSLQQQLSAVGSQPEQRRTRCVSHPCRAGNASGVSQSKRAPWLIVPSDRAVIEVGPRS